LPAAALVLELLEVLELLDVEELEDELVEELDELLVVVVVPGTRRKYAAAPAITRMTMTTTTTATVDIDLESLGSILRMQPRVARRIFKRDEIHPYFI
jgi:hypothetical protein